jgi:hypothetical protein
MRAATSKATTRAKSKSAVTRLGRALSARRARRGRHQALLALTCLSAVALSLPLTAGASDATLRVTLARWSHQIALDAQGIGLSASSRHPRRMTRRARHFRADALRATRVLAPVPASSASGRRAKYLALAAFRNYAIVGRQWALSGQARLHGRRTAAVGHARLAGRYAKKGSRLLVAAGKLLR